MLYAFFKTTCPTSELAWPFLDRIRAMAGERGRRVIGVSQDEPDQARAFQERAGTRIPLFYDPPPWRASEALGLETVPTLLDVGPDGRVREVIVGFQRDALTRLAARSAGAPVELFRPDEKVPPLRPG